MPTHPVYRAARAVVFATVCVGLAVTGHMMISKAPVPPMAAASGGAAMTFVHVAAAGVAAWWLRRGERAVWALAKRVAAGVIRRVLPPAPPPVLLTRPLGAPVARTGTPGRVLLRHVVVRRGPPAPFPALV